MKEDVLRKVDEAIAQRKKTPTAPPIRHSRKCNSLSQFITTQEQADHFMKVIKAIQSGVL